MTESIGAEVQSLKKDVEFENSGLWTRDEGVVVWAAFQDASGRYLSGKSLELLEVADLLTRSPGAVSLKMAGFRALQENRTASLRRVGAIQRAIFSEFHERDAALQGEANQVRVRLMESSVSSRVETSSVGWRKDGGSARIQNVASDSRIPDDAFFVYSRSWSTFRGAILDPSYVLQEPDRAAEFARKLLKEMGARGRPSMGFAITCRSDQREFARQLVFAKMPALHTSELSEPDLLRVARALAPREIHGFGLTPPIRKEFARIDLKPVRAEISNDLHIDPKQLCSDCVALLAYLVNRLKR